MYPIDIIGMGQGVSDLTARHLKIIQAADILVGGRRQLAMFPETRARTIVIKGHIPELISRIETEKADKKIVVLASGDPLFHGIGASFCRQMKPGDFVIHPNISSISAAFAAIKEPWHDARLISLHGLHQPSVLFSQFSGEHIVALLTDPHHDPHFIAQQLEKAGVYDFRICVLENLGHEHKQKITWFENIDLIYNQTFAQPNVVILKNKTGKSAKDPCETHIGMDDYLFRHGKGLITKSEVRSISLSKLKLIRKDHVLWDIGSGSGSVGIEASFHIPWGHVYAIEKNAGRIPDIIQNIANFDCSNVKVLHTVFPEGIDDLKQPDRIFIGGGGGDLENIIKKACDKMAAYGVIVINTVLLQNLETAMAVLKKERFNPQAVQIQVSRSKPMPFGDRFEALNPIWIIYGSKPPDEEEQIKP